MPSQIQVNPRTITSHTLPVFHQVGFHTQIIFNREVNEWSCIGEVGVDLELCVHAHGHDVDPIMKASCNNKYFLDIICFGIGELILCNRASDRMFFFDPISRASLSTCLLQSNTLVQPLP